MYDALLAASRLQIRANLDGLATGVGQEDLSQAGPALSEEPVERV
jgi:hypothetical protein